MRDRLGARDRDLAAAEPAAGGVKGRSDSCLAVSRLGTLREVKFEAEAAAPREEVIVAATECGRLLDEADDGWKDDTEQSSAADPAV